MRTQVAKLAEKPVQVPTPILSESLMQMLNQAPSTQPIDDLWGELPMRKSVKRKHKDGELDEEIPTDPAREAIRQERELIEHQRGKLEKMKPLNSNNEMQP